MRKTFMPGRVLAMFAVLVLPALAAAPGAAAQPGAPRHARVIVKFKSESALMRDSALAARRGELPPVQHAARLSQRLGIALADGYAIAPRTQVLHAQGVTSAELAARLQIDPDVEYAEVDQRVKRTAAPSDPRYPGAQPTITPTVGQWYLRPPTSLFVSAINAESAWDTTLGSPAVVVAVLDTGVRGDHPDLAGKLLPGYDFVSEDSAGVFTTANDGNGRDADASDPGDWVTQAEVDGVLAGQGCVAEDSSWHGTQTSALVAASTDDGVGMAGTGRNVRVLPVRVLGKCGGFTSDVIAGMYWAAGLAIPNGFGTAPANPYPAKVLNLSLGSANPTCGTAYQDAVTAVVNAGASVVVSAGNDAGLAVGRPANCTGAIGVGGLRHSGTKVGFSDLGPQIAISAPGGNCVNNTGACLYPILTALNAGTTTPGANTYSDSFIFSVGTSFSAPLVSGVAALMLSVNPTLTPAQVRSGLTSTARAFPTSGGTPGTQTCQPPGTTEQLECYCTTTTCGAGMLDAAAAVSAVALPAAPVARAFATPTIPPPGTDITLDGATSVAPAGRNISGYTWTLTDSGGIAALRLPRDQATATVTTTGTGTFTVTLQVRDSSNVTDTRSFTFAVPAAGASSDDSPSAGADGGGGALSWPWLLALGIAVMWLQPRRLPRP